MKPSKTVLGITGMGIGMGAGANILGGMGNVPATNAAKGLGNASGALPAVGTIGGLGMVMSSMKGLQGIKKSKGK